jgi:hypothetical protein
VPVISLITTQTCLSACHVTYNNISTPQCPYCCLQHTPTSVPVTSLITTQASLSACHVTYNNTSKPQCLQHTPTLVPVTSLIIRQAHLSAHHVSCDNTSPSTVPSHAAYCRNYQFSMRSAAVTLQISLHQCVFLYNTCTKHSTNKRCHYLLHAHGT